MNIIEKIKKVLFNPTEFFEEVKKEVGIGEAFKYLVIISLTYAIILMFFMAILSLFMGFFPAFFGIFVFLIPLGIFSLSLIGSFVGAAILHLFVKILGGKGDYSATYKASVYSSTPSLLLGWIPYVSLLVFVYTFYLTLKGFSILHEISMGRAFLVLFIPALIIGLILIGLVFIYLTGILYSGALRTTTTSYEQVPMGLTNYMWTVMTKLPHFPKF
jgi:hypothetical protein